MEQYEKNSVLSFNKHGWESTLNVLWPGYFKKKMAPFHIKFWQHINEIYPRTPAQSKVIIWFRGAGKSTNLETAVAYLGAMRKRRYCWYVSSTQQSADDHIDSISELLASDQVKKYLPSIGNRKVDRFGNVEGWRRNRLITQDGFAIDALGLDVAVRGRKLGDQRPDLIILDDLDERNDTPETTQKKIESIANKIILAGTPYVTILAGQNIILPTGIFARFADKTNTILTEADIDDPVPAIYDLKTEGNQIISGTPAWPDGMPIEACQDIINRTGIEAFLLESQHDVKQMEGALWKRTDIHYSDLPAQVDEYNIGIDPAMSDSKRADLTGIYVAATKGNNIYIVDEHSGHHHPSQTKEIAYSLFQKYKCELHIEIDNGGQWLVQALIDAGVPKAYVIGEKSGGVSKRGRAAPLADKAKAGQLFHCKKFDRLEDQMVSWVPGPNTKSPDDLDAATWACSKWLQEKPSVTRGYGYVWRR